MKYKTLEEIIKNGNVVKNDIIEYVDINIIARFGNTVCLNICCKNVILMWGYNNTANIGFMLKEFVEFLGIDKKGDLKLSEIKNIPCRLIYEKWGWGYNCIGIGHHMEDKFIHTRDFARLGLEYCNMASPIGDLSIDRDGLSLAIGEIVGLQKENEKLKEQLAAITDTIVTAKNGLTKEVFIAKRSPISYDRVLKDWNYRYTNEDESVEYDFRYCHEDKDHESWEQARQRLKELQK